MLIDIFARRYAEAHLRQSFEQRDSRLLVQAFRIIAEDFYPYYVGGKEDARAVRFWTTLHARISRELGLTELSAQWFTVTNTFNGNAIRQSHQRTMLKVCENWLLAPAQGFADDHIKERLSLVELGFREREVEIAALNAQPISLPSRTIRPSVTPASRGVQTKQTYGDQIRQLRAAQLSAFRASVDELNARFRQANYSLHYHNGYIQASTDTQVQATIETPFWALVAEPQWANVDIDMKEALDLRDSDGRDPAFFAARALESTIKIISDKKSWTTGKEKGAHNYIDNLASKSHGFIVAWEGESLKSFFTKVRNPFGHGAGSGQMPNLTRPQTEWAIEFAMSWIKSLIRRL